MKGERGLRDDPRVRGANLGQRYVISTTYLGVTGTYNHGQEFGESNRRWDQRVRPQTLTQKQKPLTMCARLTSKTLTYRSAV